jgi:hypothetical protein
MVQTKLLQHFANKLGTSKNLKPLVGWASLPARLYPAHLKSAVKL